MNFLLTIKFVLTKSAFLVFIISFFCHFSDATFMQELLVFRVCVFFVIHKQLHSEFINCSINQRERFAALLLYFIVLGYLSETCTFFHNLYVRVECILKYTLE